LGHLESALALAASKGYKTFPILSAGDVAAACSPVFPQDRPETARLARRLLARLPLRVPAPTGSHEAAGGSPAQRPVATGGNGGARPHLEILTLGGFEVRLSGGKILSDAQWTGLRQKLLLKAILVNGCREIPKDILMDALWPDSSHEAAQKRFKVTLHRLRRILEPDVDHRSVSSCISLKDNLVSLDMGRCRVDVNDFLAACDEIRQLKHDDDDQRLLSACRRAADIYRGDFLPEEPYLSWAEMKRAALKDQYLAVLMELARLFERKGDLEQATRHCGAVIQADPLAEQAHQQIMRLLQRQGRRSAALKVYRDLAETLATELDTVPDIATTQIYKKIMTTS
jgi:LuxR family maltose regulon positive regulatory protein